MGSFLQINVAYLNPIKIISVVLPSQLVQLFLCNSKIIQLLTYDLYQDHSHDPSMFKSLIPYLECI